MTNLPLPCLVCTKNTKPRFSTYGHSFLPSIPLWHASPKRAQAEGEGFTCCPKTASRSQSSPPAQRSPKHTPTASYQTHCTVTSPKSRRHRQRAARAVSLTNTEKATNITSNSFSFSISTLFRYFILFSRKYILAPGCKLTECPASGSDLVRRYMPCLSATL